EEVEAKTIARQANLRITLMCLLSPFHDLVYVLMFLLSKMGRDFGLEKK
ncbi:hypothetical protein VCHENC02_2985, partial [Vibrio harveyi]